MGVVTTGVKAIIGWITLRLTPAPCRSGTIAIRARSCTAPAKGPNQAAGAGRRRVDVELDLVEPVADDRERMPLQQLRIEQRENLPGHELHSLTVGLVAEVAHEEHARALRQAELSSVARPQR